MNIGDTSRLSCGCTGEIITHFNPLKNVLPMILSGNPDVFLNIEITKFYILINLLINIQ